MESILIRISALPLASMAALVFGLSFFGAAVACATAYLLRRDVRSVLPSTPASFVATVFALFVSFLASNVWDDASRAASAVEAEAAALLDIRAYLSGLPEGQAGRIAALLRAYVTEVAEREWPAMARGRDSPEADTLLIEAHVAALAATPDEGRAALAGAGVLRALDRLAQARDLRLSVARAVVGALKWAVVLCLAFVVLLMMSLTTPCSLREQVVVLGLASIVIGSGLLVVLATDRPFLGQISVSPTPLIQAVAGLPGGS